ncbi:ABC transporter ATP-binding protein [Neptunomonas sp. XY-337]|uniref:ABC transporter ATP-binding protein n=1 Tax=Neptunomonas sp. XY-337 TaxID=2561897 RepID=UPI0010AB47AC|nr:ABC transporter ATP-binding protein [Neptunomonas sp. XY-337]
MTETTPYALEANLLAKTFATQTEPLTLFENLSLTIKQGESVAIIGQSGAGKSTLLSLLAGLDEPTDGSIRLLGEDINHLDDEARSRWRATHLSFIFQSFHLLPELTAQENVQLPLEIRGDRDAVERARTLLTQVGLKERCHHYPSQLSGGEQQRVAIARAFVTAPHILFADEPTGNLDTKTGEKIIHQLFDMNATHQTTLILITHDPALAARCSRQYRLEQGKLLEVLPQQEAATHDC